MQNDIIHRQYFERCEDTINAGERARNIFETPGNVEKVGYRRSRDTANQQSISLRAP